MSISKLLVPFSRLRGSWNLVRTYDSMKPIICDPPPKPMAVTIIGAISPVGKTLALLLKQCAEIDVVKLFDVCEGPCGIAMDLSHIDTNTSVEAYTGLDLLPIAIKGSQIVVCCCGLKQCPEETESDIFNRNADDVRCVAMHMVEFNPKGVFCIGTPPVNAMVPMVSQVLEYQKSNIYDYRKIIGLTSICSMRASCVLGEHFNIDPSCVTCPILGGTCQFSTVPILSQGRPEPVHSAAVGERLRLKIAQAEEEVLRKKHAEESGPLVVSPAFAVCRFVTNLARALKGTRGCADCAYVRQVGHIGKFLPYMASIVKLGVHGLESSHMPELNESECKHLNKAAEHIQNSIRLGECYITGEFPTRKRRCGIGKEDCRLVTKVRPEDDDSDEYTDRKKKRREKPCVGLAVK